MSSDTRLIERWLPIAALGEESRSRASVDDSAPADLLPARLVGATTLSSVTRGGSCISPR